jgi:hypothetical protein
MDAIAYDNDDDGGEAMNKMCHTLNGHLDSRRRRRRAGSINDKL